MNVTGASNHVTIPFFLIIPTSAFHVYIWYNSGGDVKVNWKEVTKNGLSLKTGDVVSVRGKGRLEVISSSL